MVLITPVACRKSNRLLCLRIEIRVSLSLYLICQTAVYSQAWLNSPNHSL